MRVPLGQHFEQRAIPAPWQTPYPGLGRLGSSVVVTPQLQALAQAIQTQEGYYPGSLAYQNNNPGNLIYVGQAGATLGAGGFADFTNYQAGLNALYNQLNLYATGACAACGGQPLTIQQMADIYAPAGQGSNDPTVYAQNMANALGVSPDTLLSAALAGSGAGSGTGSGAGAGSGLDTTDDTTDDDDSGDDDATILGLDPTTFMVATTAVIGVALWMAMD